MGPMIGEVTVAFVGNLLRNSFGILSAKIETPQNLPRNLFLLQLQLLKITHSLPWLSFSSSPPPNQLKQTPPWNWCLPKRFPPIFPHEKKNTEKPKNQLLTVALNKAPSWKVGGRLVPGEGSLSPNAPQGPTCSPQLLDKIGLGIY